MQTQTRAWLVAAGLGGICVLVWLLWPAVGNIDLDLGGDADVASAPASAPCLAIRPAAEARHAAPADEGAGGAAAASRSGKCVHSLHVRDIFDGRPVPDLRVLRFVVPETLLRRARFLPVHDVGTRASFLRLLQDVSEGGGAGEALRSDENGHLRFEATVTDADRSILIAAEGPRLVLDSFFSRARGTLWIYRILRLRLRVRSERAVFGNAWVIPRFEFLDTNRWSRLRPEGLPKDWSGFVDPVRGKASELTPFRLLVVAPGVREFEASLPRARGLLVRAEAFGYLGAWATVDVETTPERAYLELVLRKAPLISGSVRDEIGRPVPGVRLRMHTVIPASPDRDVVDEYMWGVGRDCTVAGGETDPYMRFEEEIQTDAKTGAFAVHVPIEGTVRLRAWCEGYEPAVLHLGEVTRSRASVELVLPRLRGLARTHVELRVGGKPLGAPGVLVLLEKLEGTAVTEVLRLTLGPEGRVPTRDFERGMEYLVMLGHEVTATMDNFLGKFKWSGQERIDLDR